MRRLRLANLTLILFVLFMAIPATPSAGVDPVFVDLPMLTLNPNGNTPLSAVVDFTTDIPSQATLRITDGIEIWSVEFPDMDTTHSLPVYGLKPNRTYSVEVSLIPGGATDSSLMTSTAPLPGDFPGLVTNYADPAKMEPGYTVIDNVFHGRADPRARYMMIVDMIDPLRIGYDSLGRTSLGFDWVHDNSIFHDARDDSVIISFRHQDAVIKFSRQTGELIWILGTHENWVRWTTTVAPSNTKSTRPRWRFVRSGSTARTPKRSSTPTSSVTWTGCRRPATS